jgi:hypothetical protein
VFFLMRLERQGTRISTRKNDASDIDNSESGDVNDIDVSFNYELNLSTNIEPNSFEEDASHDEWKEAMQKEYGFLIKNGTWKLVDPQFETKPIGCRWVYKESTNQLAHFTSIIQGLWKKDMHKNKAYTMRILLPPQQNGLPFVHCWI